MPILKIPEVQGDFLGKTERRS